MPAAVDDPVIRLLAGDDPATDPSLIVVTEGELRSLRPTGAAEVLEAFAAALPGFAGSTLDFVRREFLVRAGVVNPAVDPVTVRVGSTAARSSPESPALPDRRVPPAVDTPDRDPPGARLMLTTGSRRGAPARVRGVRRCRRHSPRGTPRRVGPSQRDARRGSGRGHPGPRRVPRERTPRRDDRRLLVVGDAKP